MCTTCLSNYYLYIFKYIYIIKNRENDRANDDVYIIHIKRYAKMIYSMLER
jgi:hypothetical protein